MRSNHLKAARALLQWSQEELARRSRVSLGTIRRLERTIGDISENTRERILKAFSRAGLLVLFDDESGGIGVRLRRKKKDSDDLHENSTD